MSILGSVSSLTTVIWKLSPCSSLNVRSRVIYDGLMSTDLVACDDRPGERSASKNGGARKAIGGDVGVGNMQVSDWTSSSVDGDTESDEGRESLQESHLASKVRCKFVTVSDESTYTSRPSFIFVSSTTESRRSCQANIEESPPGRDALATNTDRQLCERLETV